MEFEKKTTLGASLSSDGTIAYSCFVLRRSPIIEDDAWDTSFKPGLRRQAELAVLAASGQHTELPTLQDALASMRLTQAIYS